MAFKLITGPYLNHLTRVATAPVPNPTMLTLFDSPYAYDNRASKAAMFSVAQEDSVFPVDLNLLAGSSFESADDAAAWDVLGAGTFSSSTDQAVGGTHSGKLEVETGATEAIAYQDVLARPGEALNLDGNVMCPAGADKAHIRIRNRVTGRWLKSDLTWSDSLEDYYETTGSAWESFDDTFTVESLAICKSDTVLLRVYLHSEDDAYFDDVILFPSLNAASIHGHNVPECIVPTLQYSDDNSSWSTQEAMTLRRDSFCSALSSLQVHRYWRILFDGTPDTDCLIYMGELVMGQYFELAKNPFYGATLGYIEKQSRQEGDAGEEFVHLHNQQPQRSLKLAFAFRDDASYEEFRSVIFRGSRGGANLIWIVPTEMDSSVVILGRVREQIMSDKSDTVSRSGDLEILEAPLPNVPEPVYAYDAPVEAEEE